MLSKDQEQYLKALLTDEVPEDTKSMVLNLSDYGKIALIDNYNVKSNFHQHADLMNNAEKFGISTFVNKNIYHYTSFTSLKKIFDSGYFKINSSDSMNDPDEFKWASKLGKDFLLEIGATEKQIASFEYMINSQPFKNSYIWSFTENRESQALFGFYGHQDGVALAFNIPKIMQNLASQNAHGKKDLSKFQAGDAYTFPLKVVYKRSIQEEYVQPIVKEWLYAFQSISKDPEDMKRIMLLCSQNMFLFNMTFKNPNLWQEEEIRFIVLQIDSDFPSEFPFKKCNLEKGLIKSITLQTGSPHTVENVTEIIKRLDSNIKVLHSLLPY